MALCDKGLNIFFLILNEEDLILISLRTYQLKLARSYVSEHLRNGIYTTEVCQELSPNLVNYGIDNQPLCILKGPNPFATNIKKNIFT